MRKKILVVDDSMFIRNMLKDILSKDYDVVEADCGANGIINECREAGVTDYITKPFEADFVVKKVKEHLDKV